MPDIRKDSVTRVTITDAEFKRWYDVDTRLTMQEFLYTGPYKEENRRCVIKDEPDDYATMFWVRVDQGPLQHQILRK